VKILFLGRDIAQSSQAALLLLFFLPLQLDHYFNFIQTSSLTIQEIFMILFLGSFASPS